ncbi:unnamed protein product [Soboliphyme baturini]|uniref:E3 ubiquitin-protein ligase HERC4 n=1 Tax=Soboliphyme baturini TaxID=241478 RepID=A0A183IG98_9BILA|nr:unnamed protein product [Soboliphyme baturini]
MMTDFEWYGCGSTADGELGLGGIDEPCVSTMCLLRPPGLFADVRLVATADHHTLVLLNDGSVYAFGNNDFGQLGRDGQRKKPNVISALQGLNIRQIACGLSHSVALTEDGHLIAWGSNLHGQLGVDMDIALVDLQVRANEINLTKIMQVCCGGFHNLALGSDGTVFSWGRNDCGQLGLGHRQSVHNPVAVKSINGIPFRQLSAGHSHSFALSLSEKLFPTFVSSLRRQKIARIVCGAEFSAVITTEGQLFTFGAGMYGQLGHGSVNNEVLPKQVLEMMGSRVVDVACGRCHTLVMTAGKLYAFGLGSSGQLGISDSKMCTVPCPVSIDGEVVRVFAAGDHSFVVVSPQVGRCCCILI